MSTVIQAGSGWSAAGSNLTLSTMGTPLGAAVTTGSSLIVTANQETALNDITGITDSGGNTWITDVANSADSNGFGRCVFRCQSVGTVPTWIKVSATTAGTIMYFVTEISGLHATPFQSPAFYVLDGSSITTHAPAFTTATSNASAICLSTSGTDPGTITPNNGFTEIPTNRNARSGFYISDLGSSGSKTLGYGTSAGCNNNHLIAVYKSAVSDPTVSTVSNESTVEGGTNTHTITLSGPTNRPNTPYSIALAGVTATGGGVDFTSALVSLTFGSSGVTFDGTQLLVPNAVTTFPIVVTTVDDLPDEASETYTLTVGGTAGTGTITDNDAPPVVTFSDGVESFGVVTCVATLGAVSGKDISFQVDTTNGTKTAGTNYTAIVAQTVTIPAGSLTAAITVNTL